MILRDIDFRPTSIVLSKTLVQAQGVISDIDRRRWAEQHVDGVINNATLGVIPDPVIDALIVWLRSYVLDSGPKVEKTVTLRPQMVRGRKQYPD